VRQRLCCLVGAVSGLFATTRLGTPGNARGRSDVPGPPYSLTVAIPEGNHFDVEMMTGPPNRFRNRARYARCVTQATPEPLPHRGAPENPQRRPWAVAAGAVCALHVLALVGLAGFYALELARGEGSSATTVVMSGVLILVFAALLALLARAWFRGSTRAAVPTFVWNGLLIPVVVALYGAEEAGIATALLVVVVLGVVAAAGAVATTRPRD
jgi:hypothetical protein